MTTRASILVLLCALSGVALIAEGLTPLGDDPAPAEPKSFPFAESIPEDVFLYVGERSHTERDFVRQYWAQVRDTALSSGLGTEIVQILGSLFGEVPPEEIGRFREEVGRLLSGVDWETLGSVESAFAERFAPPADPFGKDHVILMPDMVLILRGPEGTATKNFEGLRAILSTLATRMGIGDEAGAGLEMVVRTDGLRTATLNLLGAIPGTPRLPVSVAEFGDIVVVAFGEGLFGEVLGMLSGGEKERSLENNARFRAAFTGLRTDGDSVTYFDVQGLIRPLDEYLTNIFAVAGAPEDSYRNSRMRGEGGALNAKAMSAYQSGDHERALELIERAYEVEPESSIVLYNLACFHALNGHREVALDWLERAVEGGFHAPRKISTDPDLTTLRGDPRYRAALSRATQLARESFAVDIVKNSTKTGEGYRLRMEAYHLYGEGELESALRAIEQAVAVAPDDSRVLYDAACFHALSGRRERALEYLERAVSGGFYCPDHMKNDSDIDSLRDDERFAGIMETARRKSVELTTDYGGGKARLAMSLVDLTMDSVGILDYSATTEYTSGASVHSDTVTALTPGAKERRIYTVIGKNQSLERFDRFLPVETEAFTVTGTIDTVALFRLLGEFLAGAGPEGEKVLDAWKLAQRTVGIELRADALSWLGRSFTEVTLADGKGSVWLVEVSDEEAARAGLAATETFLTETVPALLTEAVRKTPALAGLLTLGVRVSPATHEKLEGFRNAYVAFSPQPLVYGLAEGHLIFGSGPDAIVTCLETARGEHPSIRENPTIVAEAIMPEGPFVSVNFQDRRGLGEELAAGLGMASMMSGMMTSMIPDPEVKPALTRISSLLAKLTPVLRKIDFYRSTASATTFDGQRWWTRSVTHYVPPPEREED